MPFGTMDVAFYRDDIAMRPVLSEEVTDLPFDLTGRTVVLFDDVLFTGRTVRAALESLAERGRASSVQLAVMVDRGHRELPIRPDFVGKNLPTRRDELVEVSEEGVTIGDLLVAGDRGGPMSAPGTSTSTGVSPDEAGDESATTWSSGVRRAAVPPSERCLSGQRRGLARG